jgi:hypothetical protein
MIDFNYIIGYSHPEYPAFDNTTPWYEFNSYVSACESLSVTPSVQRFLAYHRYLKSIGVN